MERRGYNHLLRGREITAVSTLWGFTSSVFIEIDSGRLLGHI